MNVGDVKETVQLHSMICNGTQSDYNHDDNDDCIFCDCTVIDENSNECRICSRFIANRCPALISFMQFDETTQRYTLRTAVDIDIVKTIFHTLQFGTIEEEWLRLEEILKVASDWELKDVKQCVVRKFIMGMNEENCIAIWRMCAKFLPDETKKVFDYVLYTVNATVNSGRNVEFFHLRHDHLFEILNADLLNVNNEFDVWFLLRKWISADRKKRTRFYPYLLRSIRYNLLNDTEKDEMKGELLRLKIDITSDHGVWWSKNIQPRFPRDFMIAIGGWQKGGPSKVVDVLDVNGNRWQRMTSYEDERKVAYHECIVIDKKMYIIGGFEGTQYFNTMRCYDGEAKKWCELAPMHHARCYISACEINGAIIVAGGSDGRSRLRTAEMYDAQKNQWSKIRSMVQRRSDAAACAMDGKMYIAGGYNGEAVLPTIEVYTPETDVWIEIAHMMSPRSGLACAAGADYMLIAGGFDGISRLSSAEILRIGSSHTISVEPMPIPRSNFAMCKMGKYIYAAGGYHTSVIKSVVRFDGKKWERFCNLSIARSALRLVLLKNWPDPIHVLFDPSLDLKDNSSGSESSETSQKSQKSKSSESTSTD